MDGAGVPRPIERLLELPVLDWLARLALGSSFLVSGIVKLIDFAGTMEEVAGLGLRPAMPFAAAVILTQLGGSALLLTRRFSYGN